MLAAMAAALVLGSGVALAAHLTGTSGNDTLRGTRQADQIYGLGGDDTIYSFASPDELYGGSGSDKLYGGPGNNQLYGGSGVDILYGGPNNDYINSADNGQQDVVNCGEGNDKVVADPIDSVNGNCEGVVE